jgi:hypothetical protein
MSDQIDLTGSSLGQLRAMLVWRIRQGFILCGYRNSIPITLILRFSEDCSRRRGGYPVAVQFLFVDLPYS